VFFWASLHDDKRSQNVTVRMLEGVLLDFKSKFCHILRKNCQKSPHLTHSIHGGRQYKTGFRKVSAFLPNKPPAKIGSFLFWVIADPPTKLEK
jgi:hypothetical protein